MRLRLAAALLAAAFVAVVSSAQQQHQSLQKGFQSEKVYQFGEIDSVNIFNGNLVVTVPIGPAFPLNGGLSYQLRLSYNSKVWDMVEGTKMRAHPTSRSNAGMGWVFGLGRFVKHDDPRNESDEDLYEAPDGGDHLFKGTRTRDGSNLRLRLAAPIAEIDFPDGTIHKFVRNAVLGEYQLTEIRGPRGTDKVSIAYVEECKATTPCPVPCLNHDSAWTIEDSRGRKHYACFKKMKVDDRPDVPMLKKVVVSSASSQTPYAFDYDEEQTVAKPAEDTDFSNDWPQTHVVPLLKTLTLPDGSAFGMSTNGRAFLEKLALPTHGSISYAYDTYSIPSADFCGNNYGPAFGFGAKTTGVITRTLKSAVPSGQPAETRVWKYEPRVSPLPSSSYVSVADCPAPYPDLDPTPVKVQLYDELIVTVTDPAGHQVVNHFSVWPGNDHGRFPDEDVSPAGFERRYYGWPYGPKHETENLYLSQEFLACTGTSCIPRRSVYVRHDPDPEGTPFTVYDHEVPHRLVHQRTVFHDDCSNGVCKWVETESSDWDGYGHYRKVRTKGFDATGPERSVETSWNKENGVQRIFGSTDKWILNTYEDVKVTENGDTAVEQACFDVQTGFLRASRTLLGLTPGPMDLAVVFAADGNGNLDTEKYYGGDGASLTTTTNLCTALAAFPATAAYTLNHDWQNGVQSSTQYSGVTWKSLDLTIDAAGRVQTSRDPGGFATGYTYHPSGQLWTVTPPGMAKTTYTYANAKQVDGVLTAPAEVTAVTASTTGDIETVYQYDSFGRLWREKHRMTDTAGTWTLRQTTYDGLDRPKSVSETVSLAGVANELAYVPQSKTDFAYDSFGRVTKVTPPDAVDVGTIRTDYVGVRTVTRKVPTATGGPGAALSDVSTTETYDAHGRLVSVTEGGLATKYTYDIGGRLHGVEMPDGAGQAQTRTFTYDKRGLLQSEQHPELGVNGHGSVTYTNYDARRHPRRKTIGSVQLDTTFDAAERATLVTQAGVGTLKQFAWDAGYSCNATTGCPGRLAAAARYNRDPVLGEVVVTEAYHYNPVHGGAERRDRTVGDGTSFSGASFFFTQSYNDLGAVHTLSYPCMKNSAGNCRQEDRQRALTHAYTRGALTKMNDWADITYQPSGLIDTVTHATGIDTVKETWAADPRGLARVRKITATKGGSELWSTGTYDFDGAGNIRKRGMTSYVYDAFQRLAGWHDAFADGAYASTRIGYDSFGNPSYSATQTCGTGGTRCAGDMFLPQAIDGTTNRYADHTYDAAGNVISDVRRTFTWDGLGVMSRAEVGGRAFHYLYSPDDERIAVVERKNGANRTTYTLRDFSNRALSMWTDDATSGGRTIAWKEDTIWRGGALLGNVTALDGVKHYVLDHLGSPRLITNGEGGVLGVQEFAPFGGGGTADGGTLQFTGHERDAASVGGGITDLPDYMHARYYDVGRGRFLSIDPVTGIAERPQTWNRYSYVANSPLTYGDPTGRTLVVAVSGLQTILDMAGSAAERLSFEKDGTINTSALTQDDLLNNEAALLLHEMSTSPHMYTYEESPTVATRAGTLPVDGLVNLDNQPTNTAGGQKTARSFPPVGVDSAISINPSAQWVDNATGKLNVTRRAVAFHELAESYAKVEQNIKRGPDNGPGAHIEAVRREQILIFQRPDLTPYPAGGSLRRK